MTASGVPRLRDAVSSCRMATHRLEDGQDVGQPIQWASPMAHSTDPTAGIRRKAMSLSGVAAGTSCTQSAFKAGKGTFLFLGPGPKGVGFKAMFKLRSSMPEAKKLAAQYPARFEVGTTGWVTARFTAEEPLPEKIWSKWLSESYGATTGTISTAKKRGATRGSQRTR